MKKRILFVAGVYGVGKTTLCDILSEKYLISSYSSSELISNVIMKNMEKINM